MYLTLGCHIVSIYSLLFQDINVLYLALKFQIRFLKHVELRAKNIQIVMDLSKYVLRGVHKDLYLAVKRF